MIEIHYNNFKRELGFIRKVSIKYFFSQTLRKKIIDHSANTTFSARLILGSNRMKWVDPIQSIEKTDRSDRLPTLIF